MIATKKVADNFLREGSFVHGALKKTLIIFKVLFLFPTVVYS